MKIPRSDSDVVSTSVVLALIICKVFFAGKVFDVKFSLFNRVCNPEESHFHGPGTLTFDGVVGDANSGQVVAIYGNERLRVAHLFESKLKNSGLFAIEK